MLLGNLQKHELHQRPPKGLASRCRSPQTRKEAPPPFSRGALLVNGASRVAPVGELGPRGALRARAGNYGWECSGQASLLDDLATAVGGSQKLSRRGGVVGAWLDVAFCSTAPGGPSQVRGLFIREAWSALRTRLAEGGIQRCRSFG